MNDTWHFLREFESKDLVKRYIKKKYNYELNSAKAQEITAAFKQGRGYFNSLKNADISVKPLLLYYGIVSLSRGLILVLDKNARENNIKPSHGLKIKNWNEIAKSGHFENIILQTSSGTFKELIQATENKCGFRANSDGVNWNVYYDIPINNFEISLKELSFSFPDLTQSIESWLSVKVPSRIIKKFNYEGDTTIIEMEGKGLIKELFPKILFKNQTVVELESTCKIKFDGKITPHLSQKWNSVFEVIGDAYIIPPFGLLIFMNDISKMFAASFIFGTISRYYPTTWNNINSGIKNDSILPFAINLMDFLEEKYPQLIIDFIDVK